MTPLDERTVRLALDAGWHLAGTCGICGEPIRQLIELHETYWTSMLDGDSLSYSPTLHDHAPIDREENA